MPEEQGTSRRRADPERRQARGKLACLRCQRRKIRCDGDLPACKNCRNVGAACTDGLSARLKDLPRAEISSLKARIAWLESIIRQRCPDIDLENGQPPQDIDPAMLEVSTLEPDTGITTNIQDLPQEIEDSMLTGATRHASSSAKSLGISYSVHLFRATKINSEIKPSPAIPKPTVAALVRCHKSATESIKILDQMYRKNFLIHNWISLHGLVLSVLTLLYCVKAEPEVARAMQTDVLTETISSALGILSATGEHWAAAKKCRDILEDLAKSTIQWLRSQSAPPDQKL
ncbi:C6 transcription factor [Cordyceps javanica]|nr:C6 transcription factor [Cordyceps javanica]